MLALTAVAATAFSVGAPRTYSAPAATSPIKALAMPELPLTLLADIVDAEGERIYGAVDAPGWVAPVGAVAVIATALLPILLAPGEEAFNRQQGDEEKVANQFGRNRKRR